MKCLNIFRCHPIYTRLFEAFWAISLNKFQMIFPYRFIQRRIKRHEFLNTKAAKRPYENLWNKSGPRSYRRRA